MAKIYWDNSQGGSWTTASDWSGGVVPGSADDVTISIAPGTLGYYYVDTFSLNLTLHSLTLDQADAILGLNGGSLATDLILDAGTVQLGDASLSGTIVGNGGYIDGYGGTLDSETLVGSVQLANFDQMTIVGGLTFATTHQTAASLVLSATTIDVNSSETWNGGTIVLGGLNTSGGIGFLDYDTGPSTLTLGSTLDVVFNNSDTIGGSATGTDTIVNDGTIAGVSGSALLLSEGTILNAGHISAGAGSSVTIDAASFTNRGSITVTAGGTLSLAATHLSNRGAIDIAGGTLALAGPTATLAEFKLATFTDGGVAAFGGTISNAHRTLTLGTAAGLPSIELTDSGLIEGGTLVSNGGLTFAGGTLSGVTFETPLDLGEGGSTLTVTGGLAGLAEGGSVTGTVMLTGFGAALDLSGVGTLSNVTIDAGSSTGTVGGYIESGATLDFGPSAGTTYTLAAGSALVQAGATLTLGNSSYYYDSYAPVFINRGAITADVAGGAFYDNGPAIDNIGSITVGGGDEFFIDSDAAFSNAGTLAVTAGGFVSITTSPFTNTGTIIVAASGTLQLDSEVTTAALGSVSVANGGTLNLLDQIDNIGATLHFGSGSTISQAYFQGIIQGGTVTASAGGLIYAGGSFDDVTFDGVLSIGGSTSQTLAIDGSFTATGPGGSGPGSIVLSGVAATLEFNQGGTLADATVTFAASAGTITGGSYYASPSQPTILTLASSLTITQTGQAAVLGNSYVNSYTPGTAPSPGSDIATAATISAAVAGGTLSLEGVLANTGTIAISNGETLAIDSQYLTNTGLISLTGGVLNLQYAELSVVDSMALSNVVADVSGTLDLDGGTLNLANDGISVFRVGGSAAPGTAASEVTGGTIADPNGILQLSGYSVFSGVTYEGTLSLSRPLASLDLIDGSSLTDGTGKLPGLIDITGAGASLDTDTLDRVTIDIGSAVLNDDGTALAPASLSAQVLGSGVTVDQTGTYASLFNQGDDTSSLTTAATIDAAFHDGAFGIWGGSVTNTGAISVSNYDTMTIGSADFVNDGLVTLSGGGITLDTLAHFASGTLAQASFTNAGTVLLNGGGIEGSTALPTVPMVNAGTIAGSGTIDANMINTGVVEATSGDELIVERTVSGSGTLEVDSGATLQLAVVNSGQRVLFSGAGGALALAPMSFLGKIEGFASGDTIDLLNTAASSASFVGDSIVVSLTAGGTLTLDTTSALSGSLTVATVNRHDSLISFAGSSTHDALSIPAHGS